MLLLDLNLLEKYKNISIFKSTKPPTFIKWV